ncbi:formyl-CoA transferase [Mesorhizobium sp. Root102]|uniref:CaiB/BaiF CoA transferase family protein n=1 Tax=Mesorhizobium sp. Root102 TaxID=1736422 RepID=UPI0006F4E5C9|nr:CoA transferase [Mesorhizobium sp. Root102]KQU92825.1 formyl-CoA transferase [Mesorhizobium sp. Root102]
MNDTVKSGGPLKGLRILDMTWMLAGPYCTMLLADLGADVIKVENPTGDPVRKIGPHPDDDAIKSYGGYFQSVNRNKRSLVLNLKTPEGKEDFFELIKQSDAIVENFRAGVMDRLGLSYEIIQAINPAIVYASVRGFGDPRSGETPLNNRPAMDYVVQAMGGLMSITGPQGGPPMKAGPGVGDIFPGAMAAFGVVSALLSAKMTGKGQYVDVAMYDAIVSLNERIVYQYGYTGVTPTSTGNSHPLWSLYNTLPTKDGYICISATFDHEWQTLAKTMGQPELASDPRFATADARLANDQAAIDVVTEWTKTRTRAEIVAALSHLISVGPVQMAHDLFEDPHLRTRNMIVELEHPGSSKKVSVAGTPVRFLGTPIDGHTRAPQLGEHTNEVREQLLSRKERS